MNKPAQVNPDAIEEVVEPEWQGDWLARMDAIRKSPEHLAAMQRLKLLDPNNEGLTTEQSRAWMAENKREWLAKRGL